LLWKNHRGDDDRSGQRPAACFIDTRKALNPRRPEPAFFPETITVRS
jgi:hypothetical protein